MKLPSHHGYGIGINVGSVIVGNIGCEDRTKYGIVGSPVNITQRIQEDAGPGEIAVSESLLAWTGGSMRVLRSFQAQLKGIREPVALFTVAPADGASEKSTNLS
jgi:adenylate cyclase